MPSRASNVDVSPHEDDTGLQDDKSMRDQENLVEETLNKMTVIRLPMTDQTLTFCHQMLLTKNEVAVDKSVLLTD